MENRHTYRRLINGIRPEPNNTPGLTTGIKQSSGKEELEKKSTDKVKDSDTDKTRSQSKAELAGINNVKSSSGGNTTRNDNDIGADNKTKEKKKSKQPSAIKQKFESNKIHHNAKTLECEDHKVNLSEKPDVKGFFMHKKETSKTLAGKNNLKCSITDTGVTEDTGIMSAVNSIETEQVRNLLETKQSDVTREVRTNFKTTLSLSVKLSIKKKSI